MSVDHGVMVLLAKSFGLFCFVLASLLVLVYALRPSAHKRFTRAKYSIVDDMEDRPAVPHVTSSSSADDESPVRSRHSARATDLETERDHGRA